MSTATDGGDGGFFTFYREYAHTGLHTITATALTAFGLLTFVHRGFVLLAIAVYVLPPIYLYLTRDGEAPEPIDTDSESDDGPDRSAPSRSASATGSGNAADGAGANDVGRERPNHGGSGDAVAEPGASGQGPTGREATEAGTEPGAGSAGESGDEAPADASDPTATGRDGAEPEDMTESEAGSDRPKPDASGTDERDDEPAAGGIADTDEERGDESEPAEWIEADSPTDETLLDAVSAGEDAYAAGTNGVLLARSGGEEWELALESGPAAESTTLQGVDVTEEGEAVWVAGDGGVLGRYDPATGRHTDHSAPEGITDNWSGLAIAGAAGGERVALVNGSGQVLFGEYDGSEVEWNDPVKPGSGSSMSAISFLDESLGYCCDTNAGVYRIEGSEFERIGIENASGFDALAAAGETVAVASDDGTLQRFDGSVWTPIRVAEGALNGLATDGEEWLAVGAGGTIHESREGDWEAADSPTGTDLHGIAAGELPVAVGADGTIVERR